MMTTDRRMRLMIEFGVWLTDDGREIPVKEMEDRHIILTINLLKRFAARAAICLGDTDREGFNDTFEQESWTDFFPEPFLQPLFDECAKRDLIWDDDKYIDEFDHTNYSSISTLMEREL